jgi:hypothetical protein
MIMLSKGACGDKMSGKLEKIEPAKLLLDLENPRFGLSEAEDQTAALKILRNRANLKELWDSITEKGFEEYEPLVAFKAQGKDEYVVVEGNRRLAAVKLLLDEKLAAVVGLKQLPVVTPKVADTLKFLPVNIVNSRHDADEYIGFKHINGPATWGSLAKAKFGISLYDRLTAAEIGNSTRLEVLSKRLGDSRQLLLRTLVGYKVFEQARDKELLDDQQLAENALDFSHLYTMLQNPAARIYLGLGSDPLTEKHIKSNPIPETHLVQLKNLMSWLFGSQKDKPLIQRQGEDRPALTRVLASASATKVLEDTRDFKRAVDEAGFDADAWSASVSKLEALAKRVTDGVSDLPSEMNKEDVGKALERLEKAARHIVTARSSLSALFSDSSGLADEY